MGAYKELKKIILNFKQSNVIAYFKNRKSGIIIYHFGGLQVILLTYSNRNRLMSSVTVCMDEFIEDREEIKVDDRIDVSIRKEFSEFCDKHYNLIENLYGRDI